MATHADAVRAEYDRLEPLLVRLSDNLGEALTNLLRDAGIQVLAIERRVKTFESFSSKLQRKSYSDPFTQTPDLCGLRIIVYYPSDLELVERVIKQEFEIAGADHQDDAASDPERFGYRSNHYEVLLRSDWLKAPNWRTLGGIKAEIQVRTILMHAWANLSHNLSYKDRIETPTQFRRQIAQLSALFELADAEFSRLRQQKSEYQTELRDGDKRNRRAFYKSLSLNADTIQAILDDYFPDRLRGETAGLVEELHSMGISVGDVVDALEATTAVIDDFEAQEFGSAVALGRRHTQQGALRTSLDAVNQRFWARRTADFEGLETGTWKAGRERLRKLLRLD